MELADDRSIRDILNGRPPRPRRVLVATSRPGRKTTRCKCGQCPQCLDDTKWERVFNEKFADPDYYTDRLGPRGCSLSWLK